MNSPPSRPITIVLAFAAGILVTAVVLTAVPGLAGGPGTLSPDPDNPPTSVTTVGPSCDDGTVIPDAGWVHELGVGDARVLTLNATVVHDPGTEVTARAFRFGEAKYDISVGTRSAEGETEFSCDQVRTRLEMAVTLPARYDRFVVNEGGETLLEVDRDDTTASLSPLPNPVNASGS